MKTQVIYPTAQANVFANIRSAVLNSQFMQLLTLAFSAMLEEEVSASQVLLLIHSTIAFMSVLLFGGSSLLVAFVLLAWFGLSVYHCKQAFATKKN